MAVNSTKVNAWEGFGGDWVTLNADVKTAQSSANILNPTAVTSSNITWAIVGPDTYAAAYRVRYVNSSATVSVQPVIVTYAGYFSSAAAKATCSASTFTMPTDGTVRIIRTDNIDSDATGLTITLDATNDQRDGTYYYSNYITPFPVTAIYGDNLGAHFIGAFVQTALATSGGSITSATLECLVLPK